MLLIVSPPPEPADDVDDKTKSATRAVREAHRLSRNLDGESDDDRDGGSRSYFSYGKRKKRRRTTTRHSSQFYHDGDEWLLSGPTTPTAGEDTDYVPKPSQYRLAGLSAQRLLARASNFSHSRRNSLDDSDPPTPVFGHSRRKSRGSTQSLSSIAGLLRPSAQFTSIGSPSIGDDLRQQAQSDRDYEPHSRSDPAKFFKTYGSKIARSSSSNLLDVAQKAFAPKQKRHSQDAALFIKEHVAQTQKRQQYLLELAKALMQYGAPTHRLESQMKMSARVLQTEAQFLYIPGCMIVAFDDSQSHTTQIKLVQVVQGIDLGKLRDTHNIYKEVVHDRIGAEEGIQQLKEVTDKPKKFKVWMLILAHGFASAAVAPFAFQGRLIDLPIAFALGLILGFLRLVWAAKSDLYSSVVEVFAVIINSFLSRWLGSIRDGHLFCFSALAQSSIALILPGYIVLCGALELQNKALVAGSVRMVYAIIYSLFIGFGLTIGTALYGLIDRKATSAATCESPLPQYYPFSFVPLFAFSLMVLNQAKWKQMPVMLVIACAGYVVSYFSAKNLESNAPVSSALAAIAISFLANMYSRIGLRVETWFTSMLRKRTPEVLKRSVRAARRVSLTYNLAGKPRSDIEMQKAPREDTGKAGPEASSIANESTATLASDTGSEYSATDNEDTDDNERGDKKVHEKAKEGSKRISHSLAAAAMLPAIFVLVPSGLSVSGSLVSGIQNADQITRNTTDSAPPATSSVASSTVNFSNNTAFDVGLNVVQVAIGITVGLFIGTLLVYPFGKGGKWGGTKKTRSALFSL